MRLQFCSKQLFSLLLLLLDASSLCLNCSQSHMILFPPQWLMMPLKFIFMLNLVMIFWGPQLFTDGSYRSLTDRWEPFLEDFYGIVLTGASSAGKKPHFLPQALAADNWRLWTWILSDFQCGEEPTISAECEAGQRLGAAILILFWILKITRPTVQQCQALR